MQHAVFYSVDSKVLYPINHFMKNQLFILQRATVHGPCGLPSSGGSFSNSKIQTPFSAFRHRLQRLMQIIIQRYRYGAAYARQAAP